ncbi:MAG: saccharopine dehydrogenase NADP-binding domain-containing protein [Bacteroidales bacterium]|nr:saccharopine dehydrogenase NADP-binding domain-containing protein [Bacteroidales bacterium]
MKKICILGSGMVSRPIIRHLLEKGFEVTVASNDLSNADFVQQYPHGQTEKFDVHNQEQLSLLVAKNDIIVSLLPYIFHLNVAHQCIRHRKHMVTTSYVKPEMQALDHEARKLGVALLNEMGLDPGIDHMSAMRIIDYIHGKEGEVEEFYSLCGALPAPESSHDNPFRYKFSWSPKGVVLAGNNSATYKRKGVVREIPTEDLFKDVFTVDFPNLETMDVYPNRNSLEYIDIYKIPEAKTIFRGTFRYRGWCESLDALKYLKLTLQDKEDMTGLTYAQYLAKKIQSNTTENLKQKTADYLNVNVHAIPVQSLEFLGFFEDKPMNRTLDSAYEITSDLMINSMMMNPNERDMCVMQHNFIAKYKDGSREMIVSRLLDFGFVGGDTSIARTVALPAALAVELLAEGSDIVGVYRPVIPEIYNPILDKLAALGIKMQENYQMDVSNMIDNR